MEFTDIQKNKIIKPLGLFLFVVSLFFVVRIINEIRVGRTIGSEAPAQSTISVAGDGEIFAVPDRATFTATVLHEGKTPEEAQTKVTEQMNAVIAFLKTEGLEDKDIKTIGYTVYPKYEYKPIETRNIGIYPPYGEQELVGYEVSHALEIKVKDTDKAGDLLAGVGALGISSLSGISFTIDDEDALMRDARKLAISDAQDKADILAKDLGVKLVRIVGYYESGNGGYPVYYGKLSNEAFVGDGAAPSPEIPLGENTIRSQVTITYEIR